MKIYYWSPHLSKVATVKSVFNSCKSLNLEKGYETKIINVIGEWSHLDKKYRIDLFGNINLYKFFPTSGFMFSRFTSIVIFILSYIPLYLLLKKNKPNFLIIHLLTSIPILLNNLSNLKTKVILRISGFPKLNIFRKIFWSASNKKIYIVTSPTIETKNILKKNKIFDTKKLILLRDPILKKEELKIYYQRNYKKRKNFLAIGRLTKQKNFSFLIECFEELLIKYKDIKLTIAGDGEEKSKLENLIRSKKLDKKVKLVGFKKDVSKLYKNNDCFILTSLWEDPGFVLVEAASHSIPIITSNCESGPKEISNNGQNMFLFKNNNKKDFLKKFDLFMDAANLDLKKKCLKANKFVSEFSINSHTKKLIKILKLKE
jgi:glycosyltransferase involved in cell wall biosynthesis